MPPGRPQELTPEEKAFQKAARRAAYLADPQFQAKNRNAALTYHHKKYYSDANYRLNKIQRARYYELKRHAEDPNYYKDHWAKQYIVKQHKLAVEAAKFVLVFD